MSNNEPTGASARLFDSLDRKGIPTLTPNLSNNRPRLAAHYLTTGIELAKQNGDLEAAKQGIEELKSLGRKYPELINDIATVLSELE